MAKLEITPDQIKETKKRGELNGVAVVEMVTKGGLSIIGTAQKGKPVILASGAVYPIAKMIAQKMEPEIMWELSKSEDMLDPRAYMHLIPRI